MGYARPKPERLADKLRHIRIALGLSQTEMHRRLEAEELITYTQISKYESGLREPPLQILLRYARAAGVPTEVLIDDELDLPAQLPGPTDHEEIRRRFSSKRKRA
ncbi:MAG TPA: helix-turn-helix transcriptional regulator [Pyrinomonadaceae bacterium]|nr:helix-turn-helix transcriptional regulator [Pyrinomonadaceae bacterium]